MNEDAGCAVISLFVILVLGVLLWWKWSDGDDLADVKVNPTKAWSLYLEAKDYELKRHQEAMGMAK